MLRDYKLFKKWFYERKNEYEMWKIYEIAASMRNLKAFSLTKKNWNSDLKSLRFKIILKKNDDKVKSMT